MCNQNGVGKRQTNLRSKAIIGLSLLAMAALCTCALAQENTTYYWMKKATEFRYKGSFEESVQAYDKALQIDPGTQLSGSTKLWTSAPSTERTRA